MRILLVCQYFWPEEFRVNDVVAGLQDRGHEVVVLTGTPNYPSGKFFKGYGWFSRTRDTYHGAQVIRTPLIPRGSGSGFRLILNYLSFAVLATLTGPLRVRGRFDLIFVYQLSPVTMALPALPLRVLRRAPLMHWVQDLWPESASATGALRARIPLRLIERFVRAVYKRCDLILVQSRAFREPVEQMGAASDRVAYLPNSAESFYRPISLPPDAPEWRARPPGFCVMFAGNIGAAQDFGTILATAEKLRHREDLHWLILGDGRLRPWVEDEVEKRGLAANIHLLGRHPAETMPRWFSVADAMLVTLQRDLILGLTIPTKVQSYLACGRPIIAALEGEGARVVSESGAGIVVPPEDPDALAEAVLAMASQDPGDRQRMGERGLAYFAQNFEREHLLDRLESWMRGLTSCGS